MTLWPTFILQVTVIPWHTCIPSQALRVTPSPPRALSPPPSRHSAAALQLNLYDHIYIYDIIYYIYIYLHLYQIYIFVYLYIFIHIVYIYITTCMNTNLFPLSIQLCFNFVLLVPSFVLCRPSDSFLSRVLKATWRSPAFAFQSQTQLCGAHLCQISQKVTHMGHGSLWLKSWWNACTMICPCFQAFKLFSSHDASWTFNMIGWIHIYKFWVPLFGA